MSVVDAHKTGILHAKVKFLMSGYLLKTDLIFSDSS